MMFLGYKCFVVLFVTCVCVLSYNLNMESAVLFEDPSEFKTRGSYFGFTVVVVNGTSSGSWVLVGAPRGNSTATSHKDIVEPGVLYKCLVKLTQRNQTCEQYILDSSGNEENSYGKGIKYHDHKDGAWIGASMDILGSGDDAEITVCGHRWANEFDQPTTDDVDMLGICYVVKAKDVQESGKINPEGTKTFFVQPNDVRHYYISYDKRISYYGRSQAGTSVHYAEPPQGTELAVGAPGILNWRGGILRRKRKLNALCVPQQHRRRDTDGDCRYESPKKTSFMLMDQKIVYSFDYFGYQVTSGKFFPKQYSYVASSPRGSTLLGNVQLFSVKSNDNIEFTKEAKVVGTQLGEYFGASMTVADVNGDGFQDLIVGSPTYRKTCDAGRVYIFHGGNSKNNFEREGTIDGSFENGRFGTTVSSLGDIDQDGYEDIAVGAPFEGNGTVYIYNGSPAGLRKDYSQCIKAEDISPSLRGFGIAISKPADVDNNHYSDIAVGSFLSEQVVLLRSHPVVKLRMLLTSESKYLQLYDTNFTAKLQLWFEGQHVDEVGVVYNVTVDEKHKRGYISQKHGNDNIYQGAVMLKHGIHTHEVEVKLKEDESGALLEPIEIVVLADLNRNESHMGREHEHHVAAGSEGNELLPVLHKYDSVKRTSLLVPLSVDCGKDTCICDLELTASLKQLSNGVFVTGSSNVLDLEISVVNKVDTAYLTTAYILLPSPVQLNKLHKDCHEPQTSDMSNSINITCDIAYRITYNMRKTITLHLDMSHVTHDFSMSVRVTTPITDKNPANNFLELNVTVVTEADMTIIGKDETGDHHYGGQFSKTFEVVHKYEVQKFKQSLVDEAVVLLNVPWLYRVAGRQDPIKPVKIKEITVFQNDKKSYEELTCYSNIQEHNEYVPGIGADTDGKMTTEHSANESSQETQASPSTLNSVVYLNCSDSTSNVECRYIKCFTRPFTANSITVKISLTMEINITGLVPYVDKNGRIVFATDGSVNITKPATLQHEANELTDHATVSTSFFSYAPPEEVDTSVYILAIIGGLLLVLLLVLGLVKAGFFRRKKREELKSLQAGNVVSPDNVDDNCGDQVNIIEDN